MGFSFNILGFHKQTKIIKDEQTKNFKQTLSSYNGVGWWKLLFYFPGWEYFMRRVFEWNPWHASKDIPHASCQTTWRRTCKSTRIFHPFLAYVFWGEGVSDDGKMANHHFGTVSLVLYLVCCCLNIYLFMKLLWKCHWKV